MGISRIQKITVLTETAPFLKRLFHGRRWSGQESVPNRTVHHRTRACRARTGCAPQEVSDPPQRMHTLLTWRLSVSHAPCDSKRQNISSAISGSSPVSEMDLPSESCQLLRATVPNAGSLIDHPLLYLASDDGIVFGFMEQSRLCCEGISFRPLVIYLVAASHKLHLWRF